MIKPFYFQDGKFYILDQRKLPHAQGWIACDSANQVADAIKTLAVRGAPAIGIAAAYGLALAAPAGRVALADAADLLKKSRPTAVNLEWAVNRVLALAGKAPDNDLSAVVEHEALQIWEEEIRANETMAELGASLFDDNAQYSVLTHCNAGSLATGGMGTDG